MSLKSLNSKAFGTVETLLVILIVAILGGTGYYVYHANKNTNDTLNSAAKDANGTPKFASKKPTTTKATDETDKRFLYTSPNHKFSMRLPDGWQLEQHQNSDAIYAFGDSKLAPQDGKTATVTTVQGGKDGSASGIFISFLTSADSLNDYSQFTKGTSFKTVSGLTVDVYSRTETKDPEAIGAVDKGGMYYDYVVTSAANKIVQVSYGFNHDETDYHSTVEQAVKTITIN